MEMEIIRRTTEEMSIIIIIIVVVVAVVVVAYTLGADKYQFARCLSVPLNVSREFLSRSLTPSDTCRLLYRQHKCGHCYSVSGLPQ